MSVWWRGLAGRQLKPIMGSSMEGRCCDRRISRRGDRADIRTLSRSSAPDHHCKLPRVIRSQSISGSLIPSGPCLE